MNKKLGQEISKIRVRFLGASVLLLIAAVGLSIIWNRSIKEELAIQTTSFVRKGIVSTDLRGVVEFLNGVQFSSFDTVTLYRPTGERVITLPPVFDFKEQMQSPWRAVFFGSIETMVFVDQERTSKLATLVFSYRRFELVHYAVIVWLLATVWLTTLLGQAIKKVQAEIQAELRLRNAEAIEEVAKKIRHNIRSPLAVLKALFLESALDHSAFLEQGKSAVLRLEEIVSEIKADFQKAPRRSTKPPIFEISKVASGIVAEKRLIAGAVEIEIIQDGSGGPVYCEIPSAELKATLSNIIDNSLQAMSGVGKITVRFECDAHSIVIEVTDTGAGIPQIIVERVFEKGFTHGKEGGSGLGLYYAKHLIEGHQGNVSIHSQEGHGTTITLIFPRIPIPAWHVDKLDLCGVDEIIVCDDQPSIIKAWQMRFKTFTSGPEAKFFTSCEAIKASLISKEPKARLYLLDYDLGSGQQTGLEFLRACGDRAQAVLVTGHFDDPEIQEACVAIGCKLLPKDEISSVPIGWAAPENCAPVN